LAAVVATLGGLIGAWSFRSPAAEALPVRLAVLPLGNIGGDTTLDFIGEGLADDLASSLARTPGVQITSRIGARLYRGQLGVDLAEAGARLKADYVLHGVVRQDRGRWILSLDFARAADAASLWAQNFQLGPDQQAGAPEVMADALILALRRLFPRSLGIAPALAPNQTATNAEAYRYYLRGQEKLDRRGMSVRESADFFREAIRLDPQFARAYSGLSMALALYPYFQGVPVREVSAEIVASARRALSLDSTLAQPHIALAIDNWFGNRWESAESELQAAIARDPRSVEARVQYARHHRFLGRAAEAMTQLQIARELDPASALVLSHVAYQFFLANEIDSALAESRRALENDSSNFTAVGMAAVIRIAANRPEEALSLARRAPAFITYEYSVARAGDHDEARRSIARLDAMSPRPWMAETRKAFAYLGLGDTSQALAALERATSIGEVWQGFYGVSDPMFSAIAGSARFRGLVRRALLSR
jgi:TolB-like protein